MVKSWDQMVKTSHNSTECTAQNRARTPGAPVAILLLALAIAATILAFAWSNARYIHKGSVLKSKGSFVVHWTGTENLLSQALNYCLVLSLDYTAFAH